ncbi:heme-binding protein, partial [Pseudomonadota bacterium]
MLNILKITCILTIVLMVCTPGTAMAVEEAKYAVIRVDDKIEIREYAPSIVAETLVNEDFEDAG